MQRSPSYSYSSEYSYSGQEAHASPPHHSAKFKELFAQKGARGNIFSDDEESQPGSPPVDHPSANTSIIKMSMRNKTSPEASDVESEEIKAVPEPVLNRKDRSRNQTNRFSLPPVTSNCRKKRNDKPRPKRNRKQNVCSSLANPPKTCDLAWQPKTKHRPEMHSNLRECASDASEIGASRGHLGSSVSASSADHGQNKQPGSAANFHVSILSAQSAIAKKTEVQRTKKSSALSVAEKGCSGVETTKLVVNIIAHKPAQLVVRRVEDLDFLLNYADHPMEFVSYEVCIRWIPHHVAAYLWETFAAKSH